MPRPASEGDPLTSREKEVAGCVAIGLCNKEIATKLSLQVGTVKTFVGRIHKKWKVRNRVELTLRWQKETSLENEKA